MNIKKFVEGNLKFKDQKYLAFALDKEERIKQIERLSAERRFLYWGQII